jgi:cell wall-associated NlpC family hydrolase
VRDEDPDPLVDSDEAQAPSLPSVAVKARLGQASVSGVDVRRLPDPTSQWLGRLTFGQQVAIVSQWAGHWAIIMGDGSQAYVSQTQVALLPYEVRAVTPVAPAALQGSNSTAGANPAAFPSGAFARGVIAAAFKYQDTPYVWGGNGFRGIDCSGLVKNCFAEAGIQLPRRASEQALVGRDVPLPQMMPGDRIYFSVKKQWDHTGIYLGNGYFIHASSGRRKVAIDHLSTPFYARNLTAARRL